MSTNRTEAEPASRYRISWKWRLKAPPSRPAVVLGSDAEPAHPVPQCVGMDFQNLSSALWAIDHSSGLLEHRGDMVALYVVETGALGGRGPRGLIVLGCDGGSGLFGGQRDQVL